VNMDSQPTRQGYRCMLALSVKWFANADEPEN
jgi:hypothetical protein